MKQHKAAVFLWFDQDAQAAAEFYAQTFPDSAINAEIASPLDRPGAATDAVQLIEMTICGLPYVLLNAGPPDSPPNNTYSLQIYTDDQAETDRLWNAVVDNGGKAIACGWCQDRWGYRWQITPRALMESLSDPDRDAARRAHEAMMTMTKIDIAKIDAARRSVSRP